MRLDGPRLAVTLLTAIPLPGGRSARPAPSRRAAAAAMAWAPAVGLLLGAAAAVVLELAGRRLPRPSAVSASPSRCRARLPAASVATASTAASSGPV